MKKDDVVKQDKTFSIVGIVVGALGLVSILVGLFAPMINFEYGDASLTMFQSISEAMDGKSDGDYASAILYFFGLLFLMSGDSLTSGFDCLINKEKLRLGITKQKSFIGGKEVELKPASNVLTLSMFGLGIIGLILGIVFVAITPSIYASNVGVASKLVGLGIGGILAIVFGVLATVATAGIGLFRYYTYKHIEKIED